MVEHESEPQIKNVETAFWQKLGKQNAYVRVFEWLFSKEPLVAVPQMGLDPGLVSEPEMWRFANYMMTPDASLDDLNSRWDNLKVCYEPGIREQFFRFLQPHLKELHAFQEQLIKEALAGHERNAEAFRLCEQALDALRNALRTELLPLSPLQALIWAEQETHAKYGSPVALAAPYRNKTDPSKSQASLGVTTTDVGRQRFHDRALNRGLLLEQPQRKTHTELERARQLLADAYVLALKTIFIELADASWMQQIVMTTDQGDFSVEMITLLEMDIQVSFLNSFNKPLLTFIHSSMGRVTFTFKGCQWGEPLTHLESPTEVWSLLRQYDLEMFHPELETPPLPVFSVNQYALEGPAVHQLELLHVGVGLMDKVAAWIRALDQHPTSGQLSKIISQLQAELTVNYFLPSDGWADSLFSATFASNFAIEKLVGWVARQKGAQTLWERLQPLLYMGGSDDSEGRGHFALSGSLTDTVTTQERFQRSRQKELWQISGPFAVHQRELRLRSSLTDTLGWRELQLNPSFEEQLIEVTTSARQQVVDGAIAFPALPDAELVSVAIRGTAGVLLADYHVQSCPTLGLYRVLLPPGIELVSYEAKYKNRDAADAEPLPRIILPAAQLTYLHDTLERTGLKPVAAALDKLRRQKEALGQPVMLVDLTHLCRSVGRYVFPAQSQSLQRSQRPEEMLQQLGALQQERQGDQLATAETVELICLDAEALVEACIALALPPELKQKIQLGYESVAVIDRSPSPLGKTAITAGSLHRRLVLVDEQQKVHRIDTTPEPSIEWLLWWLQTGLESWNESLGQEHPEWLEAQMKQLLKELGLETKTERTYTLAEIEEAFEQILIGVSTNLEQMELGRPTPKMLMSRFARQVMTPLAKLDGQPEAEPALHHALEWFNQELAGLATRRELLNDVLGNNTLRKQRRALLASNHFHPEITTDKIRDLQNLIKMIVSFLAQRTLAARPTPTPATEPVPAGHPTQP